MGSRIPKHTSTVLEFVLSIVVSIFVAIISWAFFLGGFESFVLGTIIFVAWRIIFIWLRYEKSLTTLENLVKTQIANHNNRGQIRSTLLSIFCNFEEVREEYYQTKSSIVNVYDERLEKINGELDAIKGGNWATVDTTLFMRYSQKLFDIPKEDTANSYFHAVTPCGRGLEWFFSEEGQAYLNNIHDNVAKGNIQRIFIYSSDQELKDPQANILFQLHLNSKYGIKIMERSRIVNILNRANGDDFGIYGKNFVWEKLQNPVDLKRGQLSVSDATIELHEDVFNDLWAFDDFARTHKIPDDIKRFCSNPDGTPKNIRDLSNVYDAYRCRG